MKPAITSEILKRYGFSAGANVVGITAAKGFDLAPNGFKPTDVLSECLSECCHTYTLQIATTQGFIEVLRNKTSTEVENIISRYIRQP